MATPGQPRVTYPRLVKKSRGWVVETSAGQFYRPPGRYLSSEPQYFPSPEAAQSTLSRYQRGSTSSSSPSSRTTIGDQSMLHAPAPGPHTPQSRVPTPRQAPAGPSATAGQCIPPDIEDFYEVGFDNVRRKNTAAYNAAIIDYQACLEGTGGADGGSGPTSVDYMSSVIDSINSQIASSRLRADEAVQEFNRRMDAFKEGGSQFQGLQQYTIPTGAQYIPGLEPGGFGAGIGLGPVEAGPINYNPFEAAFNLVNQTPDITSIGAPDVSSIVNLAKSFLGQG